MAHLRQTLNRTIRSHFLIDKNFLGYASARSNSDGHVG